MSSACIFRFVCIPVCALQKKKNPKKHNRSALFWHNLISSAQSGPAWHSRGPPEHIPHLCAPITASQLQQHERQPRTTSYFIKPSFYHSNKLVLQTKRSPATHRQWTGVLARVHITHFLGKYVCCVSLRIMAVIICVCSLCVSTTIQYTVPHQYRAMTKQPNNNNAHWC